MPASRPPSGVRLTPAPALTTLVWLALIAPSEPVIAAPVPSGFVHAQSHPGYLAFQAEEAGVIVDNASSKGYRLVDPADVGNALGTAIVPEVGGGRSLASYSLIFDTPGTYNLYHRLSLLPLGSGDPETATTYDTRNSVYLPRAFNQVPSSIDGRSLQTPRKNLFSNSQWPFPHNGDYAWSTTESIIYHNYSLFPAHRLEVQPTQIGQVISLIIESREPGWAIDAIALVHDDMLPLTEDAGYHPEYDGAFLSQYEVGLVTIGNPGDNDFYETQVPAYDWTGDGVIDAVRAHPTHFAGGYRGIDVWALDLATPQFPLGDTHADTGISINGRLFETHYGGIDPDAGVTPAFLDSLLIPTPGTPASGLAVLGILALRRRRRG